MIRANKAARFKVLRDKARFDEAEASESIFEVCAECDAFVGGVICEFQNVAGCFLLAENKLCNKFHGILATWVRLQPQSGFPTFSQLNC